MGFVSARGFGLELCAGSFGAGGGESFGASDTLGLDGSAAVVVGACDRLGVFILRVSGGRTFGACGGFGLGAPG